MLAFVLDGTLRTATRALLANGTMHHAFSALKSSTPQGREGSGNVGTQHFDNSAKFVESSGIVNVCNIIWAQTGELAAEVPLRTQQ